MHDNEARNRTTLRSMLEDKSVSTDEWWSKQHAVTVLGWEAGQKELDDFVLQCKERDRRYEQFNKWHTEFKREHNIIDDDFYIQ